MLSRIRNWFANSRVTSWRPGRQRGLGEGRRRRRSEGSFNRDRRLSFPELPTGPVTNPVTETGNQEQQSVDPVTSVAYHPKVQPEEVAIPSSSATNSVQSNRNLHTRSFLRRYFFCCPCFGCSKKAQESSSGELNSNRQSYRPREHSLPNNPSPNIVNLVYQNPPPENPQVPQPESDKSENQLQPLSAEQLLKSTGLNSVNDLLKSTPPQYHKNLQQVASFKGKNTEKRPENIILMFPGTFPTEKAVSQFRQAASSTKPSFLEKLSKKAKVASSSSTMSPKVMSTNAAPSSSFSKSSLEVSSKRLMKELSDLMRRQQTRDELSETSLETSSSSSTRALSTKSQFTVELVNDVLYEWYVKIFEFDKESQVS